MGGAKTVSITWRCLLVTRMGRARNFYYCALHQCWMETSYDTKEHIALLKSTLALYDRTLEDVLFFSADNVEINRSLSRKTKIPLIWCASHKMNLAVKSFLMEYEDEVEQVQNLMVELRTLKNAARLRNAGCLAAKLDNDTDGHRCMKC